MIKKKAITQVKINELIANRWSGRVYDPDRDIKDDEIIKLLEAARWAPSCYGDQPWRYIIFNKSQNNPAWTSAVSCLSEGNQNWARNAPVLMLAIADSRLTRNGDPNRWGQYDTGAASMSLCIQATELGLMVHQMGGFDANKSRQLFSIPDQFIPMAMLAIGYQLPLEKIPDEDKDRELLERNRRPLGDNFFKGTWGKSYS